MMRHHYSCRLFINITDMSECAHDAEEKRAQKIEVTQKKEEGVDVKHIFCLTLWRLEHCEWLMSFTPPFAAFGNLNVCVVVGRVYDATSGSKMRCWFLLNTRASVRCDSPSYKRLVIFLLRCICERCATHTLCCIVVSTLLDVYDVMVTKYYNIKEDDNKKKVCLKLLG